MRSALKERRIKEIEARGAKRGAVAPIQEPPLRFARRPQQLSLHDELTPRRPLARPPKNWPVLLYTLGRSGLECAGLDHLLPDPHTHADIYGCIAAYHPGGATSFQRVCEIGCCRQCPKPYCGFGRKCPAPRSEAQAAA